MSLQAAYFKRTFEFNFKARTSRGLMKDREALFIKVWREDEPEIVGIGECGPLPGLSVDARPELESTIQVVVERLCSSSDLKVEDLDEIVPDGYPSIRFALETALLDLRYGGKRVIFNNDFIRGQHIPINGLIWMGDMDFTMSQINIKIAEGFRCIKLKVGGLDFDRECDILHYIRKRYYREDITIRLDANGAFKLDDVLYRLEQLAKYNIHSIEQPIKPGQPEMEELCRKSPIPVAFDEELIGRENNKDFIKSLNPQFLILKPTLHGGFHHCAEWIQIAEAAGIGWWITSALESSIGLNAICQFAANYPIKIPQGLGTGTIYHNNIGSPLEVEKGFIKYGTAFGWDDVELPDAETPLDDDH